ncbi:DUF2845 domain-containing protein [Legionella shakespearei]|uniref:DUF2845 domain-containing protein n=1 Tax=Legionella shakespearei DSM 23087 TaxID=1122169 RepID=A0A0W0ZEK1_9GAMM|nr:DUF2845 domain-containing protein [Legionella shakespearei]KTD67573.1 hypothetical protein Lsha_0014 [Legionella shakespearei DSM 23087]
MKKLIFLLFLLLPILAFSSYRFDKMRCQGQLVEAGTSIEEVKQLCGEPIFEKTDENPFRTFVYMTYKAEGASSRYYLLFRNGYLEVCGLKGYNTGENIWENPLNQN